MIGVRTTLIGFSLPALMRLIRIGANPAVTLDSLLDEMVDYEAVARRPAPEFKYLETSSHDPATLSPDQPGWFANDDHTQQLRTEVVGGRREHVMMDAEGPGSIVRSGSPRFLTKWEYSASIWKGSRSPRWFSPHMTCCPGT